MKKSIFILVFAVLAFGASSCSATLQTMKEPTTYFELNSNDYTLSEPVTGEATITRILGIDWSRLFKVKAALIDAPVVSINTVLSADSMYAIYDLLEKHPGYDFVMYPQIVSKTDGFYGIFTTTTVKVTGRLGKLKK